MELIALLRCSVFAVWRSSETRLLAARFEVYDRAGGGADIYNDAFGDSSEDFVSSDSAFLGAARVLSLAQTPVKRTGRDEAADAAPQARTLEHMPISPYLKSLRERVGNDLLLLPAVSAVIRNDFGEVLLARSHGSDEWALIGGGLEPGEEPAAALLREIREELGVEAEISQLVGAYGGESMFITYPNGDRCAYVTTAYACRLVSATFTIEEDELREVAWFTREELSRLETQPHVARILTDAGIAI